MHLNIIAFSVRATTGEIVQHYGYHTYGGERFHDNTSAFSVSSRYTGQTLDEDTGLYYYGARYYDPEVARFIQADSTVPDPEFSQSYNRYAYVYNNPLKFTDPTGQYPFWTAAAGAFAGAYMGAMQAAWAGGNIVMGAYVGLVNGAASTYIIPTISGASTALTSALTGNTSSSSFTSEWNVSISSYNDTHERKTTSDWLSTSYDPDWSPVTYDYGRGANPTRADLLYAAKEAGHEALDFVGLFDPTPISDGINAVWYASEGRRGAATISAMAMIPYVGDLGKAGRRGLRALRYSDDVARGLRRGWNVGDPITNLTRAGRTPIWPTVRRRIWKNEAFYKADDYSPENLARMRKGLAEQRPNPGQSNGRIRVRVY